MSTIRRVGVVGAGQMGRGIAQVAAQGGLGVVLVDVSADLAARGRAGIEASLGRLVEKAKLAPPERDAIMARIAAGGAMADLAGVDFAIEAVSENVEWKQRIFTELDRTCRPDVILASNTSSISIAKLGASTRRADRVVGMHFMNPVPVMRLCEVVRAPATSEETVRATLALGERLGKVTVVSRDVPGFIVNRVLAPMLNQAVYLLQQGVASAEDIDKAIKVGLNHPMGPLALLDLIGLDTAVAILDVLHQDLGDPQFAPCPLLRELVAAGRLGRKSGRGFYTY